LPADQFHNVRKPQEDNKPMALHRLLIRIRLLKTADLQEKLLDIPTEQVFYRQDALTHIIRNIDYLKTAELQKRVLNCNVGPRYKDLEAKQSALQDLSKKIDTRRVVGLRQDVVDLIKQLVTEGGL
jgi:hypothetical protein